MKNDKKISKENIRVQPKFLLKNGEGYEFNMLDLGGDGVKIMLSDDEDSHAVLLTPVRVRSVIEWLTNTVGVIS